MRNTFTRLVLNPAVGCSVRSNEVLFSVNTDFFDQLKNYRFLKYKISRGLHHCNEILFLVETKYSRRRNPKFVVMTRS
jgi:hypothetical protein